MPLGFIAAGVAAELSWRLVEAPRRIARLLAWWRGGWGRLDLAGGNWLISKPDCNTS